MTAGDGSEAAAAAAADLKAQTFWVQSQAGIAFTFASVGMMTLNKLAVQSLPLATVLCVVQNFATLAILFINPASRVDIVALEPATAKKWSVVVVLFVAMLVSSLKTLTYLNVSTVLIFRNATNIVAAIGEWKFLGEKINFRVGASLVGILIGVFVYGRNNAEVNEWGCIWMVINAIAQVAYSIYVKWVTSQVSMSKYQMSYYNNVLSVPLLLVVLVCFGEHTQFVPAFNKMMTTGGWVHVGLSCLTAFFISTTGFQLQKVVTATSFMVINNLNKIFVIFFGIVVLRDKITGVEAVSGCIIALLSGFWYSYERFRQAEEKKAEEQNSAI